jgi:hypothetical protein
MLGSLVMVFYVWLQRNNGVFGGYPMKWVIHHLEFWIEHNIQKVQTLGLTMPQSELLTHPIATRLNCQGD